MKAVKANKVYSVTEENAGLYAAQGFDIQDDDGKVIEYGKGKTVDYAEYEKLQEAYAALDNEHRKLLADYAELEKEYKELREADKAAGNDSGRRGKTAKKAGE